MNIGIDATGMGRQKGGAAFYVTNIIRALADLDRRHAYFIFCSARSYSTFRGLPANFNVLKTAPANIFLRLLWEQTILPVYLCRKYKIQVLFGPNYIVPMIKWGFKTIVTIHDLSFYPLSRLYPLRRKLFKWIIPLSVKRADKVIAVSECTRKDIIRYIGDYNDKITVIYEAAEERFKRPVSKEQIGETRQKYKIGDVKYLLFVGFLEPRKNLERLIRAFHQIRDKVPHVLVIAGGKGWWYNATYRLVNDLGLGERALFTGYVDDEDMPALYAGADLFAFPSLYEGFGIAALESICCGTPVLASSNSALPEVVGEAGVYADPFDVDSIAQKLLFSLTDSHWRIRARENCSEKRADFSWRKTALSTLAVLNL